MSHTPLRKLTMDELARLSVPDFKAQAKLPLVVVLDNARSLNNVGSIFRTADAFLVRELILCGFTGTPPHRDIHKTALGSTESVAWQHYPETTAAVQALKAQGYSVWAVEQTTASTPLATAVQQLTGPTALVLGNEINGVDDAVLALCDGAVEIPQYGTKHSLNIAVAAGIVIHAYAHAMMARHNKS